jgi:hypothetical protein
MEGPQLPSLVFGSSNFAGMGYEFYLAMHSFMIFPSFYTIFIFVLSLLCSFLKVHRKIHGLFFKVVSYYERFDEKSLLYSSIMRNEVTIVLLQSV